MLPPFAFLACWRCPEPGNGKLESAYRPCESRLEAYALRLFTFSGDEISEPYCTNRREWVSPMLSNLRVTRVSVGPGAPGPITQEKFFFASRLLRVTRLPDESFLTEYTPAGQVWPATVKLKRTLTVSAAA